MQKVLRTLRNIPSYIRKLPSKTRLAYQCIRAPYFKWVPPGHYYSPLPDMKEVGRRAPTIYAPPSPSLAGIDLRSEDQGKLLLKFVPYASELPFERSFNPNSRFFRPNGSFPFQDAFMVYAMLRHLRPTHVIEVGSGASSCVMLDTCEALNLSSRLTFIEPYPEHLLRLVHPEDRSRFELKQAFLQDIPLELFTKLEANDILFIDTSHVSKVGGVVNHVFFEILPMLKPGVVVHFHDIWYPFEYPNDWLWKGMFWNEAYLLRAFLMYNTSFEIFLFNSYLNKCMTERVKQNFPMFLEEPGASLWLRRK
jgi:hypothetical protein